MAPGRLHLVATLLSSLVTHGSLWLHPSPAFSRSDHGPSFIANPDCSTSSRLRSQCTYWACSFYVSNLIHEAQVNQPTTQLIKPETCKSASFPVLTSHIQSFTKAYHVYFLSTSAICPFFSPAPLSVFVLIYPFIQKLLSSL